MTIAAIREKLHDYINVADDDKVKAIYTLLEEQIAPDNDRLNDKNFVDELNERVKRYESGVDKGYSLEEVKALMNERKQALTK